MTFRSVLCGVAMAIYAVSATAGESDVELVDKMADFQYFAHKTALSVDAGNAKLAAFYLHELEEVLDAVKTIETYDDQPVGALTDSILSPAVETFEVAVESGDWHTASQAFDGVIAACNRCHQAAAHRYIRIERQTVNPFMQSFVPSVVP